MVTPPIDDERRRRFWSKVDKSGDCWTWTAGRDGKYGKFCMPKGQSCRAHRISYEMAHGPIPDGMFVCHRCDNPLCVRPDHLFIGSNRDNVHDAVRKGRMFAPVAHSTEKIKDICDDYLRGVDPGEIAANHDVSTRTIYRHLRQSGIRPRKRGASIKLSDRDVAKIIEMYQEGRSMAEIGRHFLVGPDAVRGRLIKADVYTPKPKPSRAAQS
jgi:hypothetical protein